jgi:mercuric ion binding protein
VFFTVKEAVIMSVKRIWLILAGVFFFLTGAAQARVSVMTVAVDGMACPFCAYGVEKRLKTVSGVDTVSVDMKTGTANLTAKPELSIHFQGIPKAVKDAGFTAGVMKVTVSGTVETDTTSSYVLRFDDQSVSVEPGNNEIAARLRDLAGSGKSVVLQGVLDRQTAENWRVTLESMKEEGQ